MQGAVSHPEDHGEIMVPLCRLHLESIDTRNLRVVRGVVLTEKAVDGGGDVVNFSAELKIKVACSECPLSARVRLGIAHMQRLYPFPFERKNRLRDNHATLAENKRKGITTLHGTNVETNLNGWCIATIQTRNTTRDEIGTGRLFDRHEDAKSNCLISPKRVQRRRDSSTRKYRALFSK